MLLALVALGLVAAGLVVLHGKSQAAPQVQVVLSRDGSDVAVEVVAGTDLTQLLTDFELLPVDGRLLSVSGEVLEASIDPAQVLVDGSPVELAGVQLSGQSTRVEVVDGVDRVEGTRTVVEEVPPPAGPDVLRHVEERGAPGRVERTIGEVSGEVASVETVVAPRAPVATTSRVVALTFDDGPSAAWTPYVLEILRSRGVKATFCMVGTAVAKNPELARRIVAEGHQVCNHTQGHDLGLAEAGAERVQGEVGGGRATMIDNGLPEPGYYRPPGGNLSDTVVSVARSQGERVLMWKVDTKDWQSRSTTESVLQNLREQVEPGAVILMHDGGGSNRFTSVAVLATVIDELKAQGYGFTFPIIDPP